MKNKKNKLYIINAKNKILGRLISKIIFYLCGKNKINYSSNVINNNNFIIINAKKILITGNKRNNKIYYFHTGYIGGIKKINFKEMIKKNPKKVIRLAIKGMMPKNLISKYIIKKIKIYNEENYKNNFNKIKKIYI